MSEEEVAELIEPIENWHYQVLEGGRSYGKSYVISMLDEKEKQIKQLQQELTNYKERNEKAIEYIKECLIVSDAIPLKDTIAGKDLLEILDKKDFNDMTHIFDNATSIDTEALKTIDELLDKKDKE